MTAAPARMSSEIPQSKSCFRMLPLIYHPEGQNKASEMPENDILTLKTKSITSQAKICSTERQKCGFQVMKLKIQSLSWEANSNEKQRIF